MQQRSLHTVASQPTSNPPNKWKLTQAEVKVVQTLISGNETYQEIADALNIGLKTVQTHLSRIRRKMCVKKTGGIVVKVMKEGL